MNFQASESSIEESSVLKVRRSELWKSSLLKSATAPELRIRALRFLCSICCCIAITLLVPLVDVAAQADDKLDQYLERLNLDDLRIFHLEDQISQRTDPVERNELAQQLTDLYADRLMELTGEPEAYNEALERVERLLNSFPSANNSSLRVMILQAEYLRAEELVSEWLEDRSKSSVASKASEILGEVSQDFVDELKLVDEAIRRLDQRLANPGITESESLVVEDQLRKQQVIRVRSEYYAGWTNYYAGLLANDNARKASFLQRSHGAFCSFLGIDKDQKITDVDGDWIDLESLLQTRGLAGLGMAYAALNRPAEAEHLFGLLHLEQVPQEVRNTMSNLELQAWLNAGDLERATEIATDVIESFSGKATKEQTRFSVALVRYSATAAATNNELVELGVEGLIRQRQFKLLKDLKEELNFDLGEGDSFYLAWANANLHFTTAEETGNRDEYLASIADYQIALTSGEAKSDARNSAHCRYQMAWAMFYVDQFEDAAVEFERVSLVLAESDQETAANAAWKRYECFQKLAQAEPRFQVQAIEALRALRISFPDHRLAKSAEIHLSKLERARLSLDESIEQLEKVGSSEPNYRDARFELCVLYHNVWNQKITSGNAANAEAKDTIRAVDRFVELSTGMQSELNRRVKSMLLVADIGLRSNPSDPDLTNTYLNRARSEVTTLPDSHNLQAEYHYQLFQLSRIQGNESTATREADWLIKNAPGSAYVLSALVQSAKTIEKELQAAPKSEQKELQLQAKDVYRRMVGVLGTSPETLQSNKNARVALFRLAKIDYELGRTEDCLDSLRPLLNLDPSNESYLRFAGLAYHQSGNKVEALPFWQKLSQGTTRGSDSWLEAKYYLIDCLNATDRKEAQKVLDQFRVLYPKGKAGAWEDSFQALERRMN